MHDAERVRLGDRVAGLEHAVDGRRHGHRPVPADDRPEVVALEELHDHVGRARLERAHVEHARDVVALEAHGGPRLAREALDQPRVREAPGEHELERHLLIELQVRRRDDDAHPTDAEDAVDAVLAGEHLPLHHRDASGRQALEALDHAFPRL